jgi:hypothetical protein
MFKNFVSLLSGHFWYIYLNIRLLFRGKLIKAYETDLDSTDYKAVNKNVLHSLATLCYLSI